MSYPDTFNPNSLFRSLELNGLRIISRTHGKQFSWGSSPRGLLPNGALKEIDLLENEKHATGQVDAMSEGLSSLADQEMELLDLYHDGDTPVLADPNVFTHKHVSLHPNFSLPGSHAILRCLLSSFIRLHPHLRLWDWRGGCLSMIRLDLYRH